LPTKREFQVTLNKLRGVENKPHTPPHP
jgi:hypothetical protein